MSNALFMVFLTTCYLKTPVNLFKEYKSRHLMCESYVAEADPSVGTGADFGRDAVAAAYYDLKRAAAVYRQIVL